MDLKLLQQELYKILSLDNNLYLDYLKKKINMMKICQK